MENETNIKIEDLRELDEIILSRIKTNYENLSYLKSEIENRLLENSKIFSKHQEDLFTMKVDMERDFHINLKDLENCHEKKIDDIHKRLETIEKRLINIPSAVYENFHRITGLQFNIKENKNKLNIISVDLMQLNDRVNKNNEDMLKKMDAFKKNAEESMESMEDIKEKLDLQKKQISELYEASKALNNNIIILRILLAIAIGVLVFLNYHLFLR